MEKMRTVQRLRSRILDEQLRASIGKFAELCGQRVSKNLWKPNRSTDMASTQMAFAEVNDQIDALNVAHEGLVEQPGVHLRNEIERRGS